VGCPLRRLPFGAPICAAEVDSSQSWATKLIRTLEVNYARAPNFARAMELLVPLIQSPEMNLAARNIAAIQSIAVALGLDACRLVRQSSLSPAPEGRATELLIKITQAVGGGTYMAGGGATGYQEDDLFARYGLALRYQNFTPRPYGPRERYIPGLSVIDYLMQDGRPLEESFPDNPPPVTEDVS
jgi:hypothetical protein